MRSSPTEAEPGRFGLPLGGRARLVVLSFLMLFAELGLIRYSAENSLYLAFFTNLVLIGSFLGIGIGFLRSGKTKGAGLRLAPVVLSAFVTFFVVLAVQQESVRGVGWFGLPALPGWIDVPLIFLGTAASMAFVAEGVGAAFARFEPLTAYRLDILGSLLGVVGFSLLAFLGAPPLAWVVILTACFVAVLGRGLTRAAVACLGVALIVVGVLSFWPDSLWSPYYHLNTRQVTEDGQVSIWANGRPHQTILPVARVATERPYYLSPYQYLNGSPQRVLIIGAGSGTDVAIALSQGAGSVEAVEIDPTLYRLGRDRNPDHPYQDPRVHVSINDGRAFLESTDQVYDLILLALPDSLTLVGGQGSLRLENYLFTTEAINSLRDHLAPGGTFSMYNYYGPVAYARNVAAIDSVFGVAPCVDLGPSGAASRQMASLTVGLDRTLDCGQVATVESAAAKDLATDDHPFPYMRGRSIPPLYLVSMALVLLVSIFAVRWAGGPLRQMHEYLDLFFMGAAFLLLETKSVVQFALLFGTTWLVNALVFAGVLLAVLVAISTARRVTLGRPWILYSLLLASLAAAWLVPSSALLAMSFWPRFAAAIALAFTPIFLANLVFAERFKDVGASTTAFGANLLGAILGGVLEYSAMILGYRALLVMVAVLYGLAFLTGRRHLRAA